MISKLGSMQHSFCAKAYEGKLDYKNDNLLNSEYDDEYVCQNLKKANLSVCNNFGDVVKKFKTNFLK